MMTALITCPKCKFLSEEVMPEDSCQFFYTCKNCNQTLKPQEGDCCVFCSYSDSKCPPKLIEN